VHIDHIKIRYETMKKKILISKFEAIQYSLNFLCQNSIRYKPLYRILVRNETNLKKERDTDNRQTDRRTDGRIDINV